MARLSMLIRTRARGLDLDAHAELPRIVPLPRLLREFHPLGIDGHRASVRIQGHRVGTVCLARFAHGILVADRTDPPGEDGCGGGLQMEDGLDIFLDGRNEADVLKSVGQIDADGFIWGRTEP